jgi:hypothetical protein
LKPSDLSRFYEVLADSDRRFTSFKIDGLLVGYGVADSYISINPRQEKLLANGGG